MVAITGRAVPGDERFRHSSHTVRDYIKAVFDQVGVSSRGELVAKLFADHYTDPFHETPVEIH